MASVGRNPACPADKPSDMLCCRADCISSGDLPLIDFAFMADIKQVNVYADVLMGLTAYKILNFFRKVIEL